MKDPSLSMNALYWYCRSLLATHSSFETSSNNLERLFSSNRQYLNEHSRGEPPIFVADKKNPLLSAQKQASTKSCLSHFVDFQYDVLRQGSESDLRAKLAAISKSLESLLEASAFSDQLLFKLVIINTFSMEKANTGECRQILVEFMVQLGQTFADRLTVTFEEMMLKPTDPRQLRSIRLLLPLLAIVELIARRSDILLEDEEGVHFWDKVSALGTLIRRYFSRIDTIIGQPEPEEFQTLKGYRPYNFLNPLYVAGSPFIDQNEARKVLDLQATQTQSSMVDSRNEETKARMASFIRLCDFCCSQDTIPIHFAVETYQSRPPERERSFDRRDRDSPCIQRLGMEEDSDDDGGDVVVTSPPIHPGPFDSSSTGVALTANLRIDEAKMRNGEFSMVAQHDSRQISPAPVMPPPGFGFRGSVPPGTPRRLNPEAAPQDEIPIEWPTLVNGPQYAPPQKNIPKQYHDGALQVDYDPEDVLGGIFLSTQNPFAPPLPQLWPPQNWNHSYSEAYPPIADMLGSGLLETIFMTDSSNRETRNPFAT
jgi:Est1 DNA/RNA binding domain